MTIAGFRSLPLSVAQLSLPAVLKCGQSFRWQCLSLLSSPATPTKLPTTVIDSPPHEWRLALDDRVICLRQAPTTLYYRALFPLDTISPEEDALREASTVAWLRDYFQLDIDLVKLYEQWSEKDAVFRKIQDRFGGIRMLRQSPWENVIS